MKASNNTPIWMGIVIVLCMLPALYVAPYVWQHIQPEGEIRFLAMLYPLYVIVAGICAWITYAKRPEVSWILVLLMVLSHAGIFYLAS